MSKDWDLPKDVIGVVDISRVDPARKSVFGFAPQISPDGTRLLISEQILNSANTDKAKWRRVHDLTSGEDVCRFDAGPGSRLSTAFSPDGMVVAIGSFDKQITLWDATTGKVRKQFTFDKPVWEKVAYMPDGSGFVACLGGSLVLLDADTGTARRTFGDSSLNAAHAVLSPSGEVLAAYTKSQKSRSLECISIWDVATGGLIKELKPFGSIHSLMFSPDGWIVYSLEWQSDGYLLVAWDLSSGRHRFAIQAKRISNLVLSPDGRLASYYSDSELVVHNLVTGKERRLRSRFGPDGNPAFFPGGTLLATTSNGNFVVWKVAEIEPASGQ
jgi:WD40 repeat protein